MDDTGLSEVVKGNLYGKIYAHQNTHSVVTAFYQNIYSSLISVRLFPVSLLPSKCEMYHSVYGSTISQDYQCGRGRRILLTQAQSIRDVNRFLEENWTMINLKQWRSFSRPIPLNNINIRTCSPLPIRSHQVQITVYMTNRSNIGRIRECCNQQSVNRTKRKGKAIKIGIFPWTFQMNQKFQG